MIRVGIIGLGKIAFEYQLNNESSLLLTHMSVLLSNPKFQVIYGIDSDISKREKFTQIFKLPTFDPQDKEIFDYEIEMLVVSTPTESHFTSMQLAKKLKPKLILLEKPLASNIEEAKLLYVDEVESKIKVFVNYQRNYHKRFVELKNTLSGYVNHQKISIIGYFTGDWVNSGSHLIALIQFLIKGELKVSNLLPHREDFLKLNSESSDIYIVRLNQPIGSIFRMHIFTPDLQIDYDSTTDYIRYYEFAASTIFRNEKILKETHSIKLNEPEALIYTYDNIISYFEGNSYEMTDVKSSYKVMQLIHEGSL